MPDIDKTVGFKAERMFANLNSILKTSNSLYLLCSNVFYHLNVPRVLLPCLFYDLHMTSV